jgi:hypothetical protein
MIVLRWFETSALSPLRRTGPLEIDIPAGSSGPKLGWKFCARYCSRVPNTGLPDIIDV